MKPSDDIFMLCWSSSFRRIWKSAAIFGLEPNSSSILFRVNFFRGPSSVLANRNTPNWVPSPIPVCFSEDIKRQKGEPLYTTERYSLADFRYMYLILLLLNPKMLPLENSL